MSRLARGGVVSEAGRTPEEVDERVRHLGGETRVRPPITVTLSREGLAMIEAIATAWGCSRSAALERLIREQTERTGAT